MSAMASSGPSRSGALRMCRLLEARLWQVNGWLELQLPWWRPLRAPEALFSKGPRGARLRAREGGAPSDGVGCVF